MPAITSHQLRRLAEKADAMRNVNLDLVINSDGTVDVEPSGPSSTATVTVRTDSDPGHVPLERVFLHRPRIIDPVELSGPDGVDAVVWEESAVQKFVFPYYACTDPRQGYERIWSGYWSATATAPIYAVLHDRSRPRNVKDTTRSSLAVVSNPAPDAAELLRWDSANPDDERRISDARRGIFAIEDFGEFLRLI